MDDDLLDLLAYELGEIYRWEEECPGVYYLAVLLDAANAEEYYIVLEDAPISQEARDMGKPLQNAPVLTYLLDSEDGAHTAVRYEVLKYLTLRGFPLPKASTLLDAALFGMERRPDYFGAYSPRGAAPSGTVRWTTACTGSKQNSAWRLWLCAIRSGMESYPRGCRSWGKRWR